MAIDFDKVTHPTADFRLYHGRPGEYTGTVRCPCCNRWSQISARVVADQTARGKHFEGDVINVGKQEARKNTQFDLYEAMNKQKAR